MQNVVSFVPASELKRRYAVHGHFYDVKLPSGVFQFRSVLDISLREVAGTERGANIQLPDAVFVMMNPGSSKPLEGAILPIPKNAFPLIQKQLVLTKPDTTQYQVMRVMSFFQWEYVRVLNLSDLRNSQSSKFVTEFQSLEYRDQFFSHTIFSDQRAIEVSAAMVRKSGAPIVCAWGVNPGLNALIKLAIPVVEREGGYIGLAKSGAEHLFYHPLPTTQVAKQRWVEDMCALLRRGQ